MECNSEMNPFELDVIRSSHNDSNQDAELQWLDNDTIYYKEMDIPMSREEEIVDEEPLINEEMADPNDKSIAEANACNEKFSLNRSVMVGPDEPLPKRVINFSQTIQTQIRPIFDIRTFSSDSKSVHFLLGWEIIINF